MHPYGMDPQLQLRFAREHATLLREEWGRANNSSVCRLSSFVEQCRARIFESFERPRRRTDRTGWRLEAG
jgi:hypothetical protein